MTLLRPVVLDGERLHPDLDDVLHRVAGRRRRRVGAVAGAVVASLAAIGLVVSLGGGPASVQPAAQPATPTYLVSPQTPDVPQRITTIRASQGVAIGIIQVEALLLRESERLEARVSKAGLAGYLTGVESGWPQPVLHVFRIPNQRLDEVLAKGLSNRVTLVVHDTNISREALVAEEMRLTGVIGADDAWVNLNPRGWLDIMIHGDIGPMLARLGPITVPFVVVPVATKPTPQRGPLTPTR